MASKILQLVTCLCLFISIVKSENLENNVNDLNNRRTRVQVKIPNFFKDIASNFERMTDNVGGDTFRLNSGPFVQHRQGETAVPPHIHRIRENYQALREFIRSALRLSTRGMNNDGLFALDLRNNGPNTRLNVDTLLGKLSINSKAPITEKPAFEQGITESHSTEVPLNEYLGDLLEEQTRRLGDFSMNMQDARGNPIISIKNSNKRTRVNLSSPVQVSVDSKTGVDNIKRSGFLPPEDETDDLDPEQEYLKHAEDLYRQNLKLRGYDVHFTDTPEFSQARSAGPIVNDPALHYSDRRKILPFSKRRDPIKKMTEYYYNLSTGKFNDVSTEDEAVDDYINDLERVTGTLRKDSKSQLKAAFKGFKKSLENIDFGDNVDMSKLIEEPEDVHSWVPGRIVDQKDLEIAFLNIDKDDKPNPGDRMILAFTLTGIPLKIYMNSIVENPIQYLHEQLSEAGVTLNIPVKSFKEMNPVDGEVLYVGANNRGFVTRAMSIIVPSADKIPSYVNQFSKANANYPIIDENEVTLTQAVQKTTSSEGLKFSDVLAENYKKEPGQVLDDIIGFLRKSPVSTTDISSDEVTVETEN